MAHLACSEALPCLWNYGGYQEQQAAFFRWSAVRNTGTIEQVNMQIAPLEEDWIEFEFLAGKAPKYSPVEEFIETVLGEPLPPLLSTILEESGGGTPWVWPVYSNPVYPNNPSNPWFPWFPGDGCRYNCNPIIIVPEPPVEPAPVPIPAGAVLLPVGMVMLYLLKRIKK